MVKKFCPKGTLIFFVRKNLRHIFFSDRLGASVLKMLHVCNIGYG